MSERSPVERSREPLEERTQKGFREVVGEESAVELSGFPVRR